MIRRPPRSTLDRSSAASDVYKRQKLERVDRMAAIHRDRRTGHMRAGGGGEEQQRAGPVSYTHLRAHETVLDLVCRLLLEKKTQKTTTEAS